MSLQVRSFGSFSNMAISHRSIERKLSERFDSLSDSEFIHIIVDSVLIALRKTESLSSKTRREGGEMYEALRRQADRRKSVLPELKQALSEEGIRWGHV